MRTQLNFLCPKCDTLFHTPSNIRAHFRHFHTNYNEICDNVKNSLGIKNRVLTSWERNNISETAKALLENELKDLNLYILKVYRDSEK